MTARNRHTLIVGALVALLVAGIVSYFASRNPDGLEAAQERLGIAASAESGVAAPPSLFREYGLRWLPAGFASNAIAGVTGAALVLGLLLGTGALLRRSRRGVPGARRTVLPSENVYENPVAPPPSAVRPARIAPPRAAVPHGVRAYPKNRGSGIPFHPPDFGG